MRTDCQDVKEAKDSKEIRLDDTLLLLELAAGLKVGLQYVTET